MSVLVATALLACPSTDLLISGGPEQHSGAPDTSLEAAAASGCVLATPPPPPRPVDIPGSNKIVLAVRTLTLQPGKPFGYDLDGYCTCDGGADFDNATACTPPTPNQACDDSAGRDNATFGLLARFGREQTFHEEANAATFRGESTTLVEISDYGEVADDSSIKLVFYTSTGTWPMAPDGGSYLDDAGTMPDGGRAAHVPPKWDSKDVWATDPSSFANEIPITQASGYVRDWVVVGKAERLQTMVLPSLGGSIALNDATFTMKLVQRDGHWEAVDGQISGRVAAEQVNAIFRVERDIDASKPTCKIVEPPLYPVFKNAICGALDVMENPNDDGRGRVCNALSYGVSFDAVQAIRGLQHKPEVVCPNATDKCP